MYDPEASNNARAVCPALTYVANAEAAMAGADLVLHLTDWPEFAGIDPRRAGRLVRRRRIIDGRNKLDPDRWRSAGWAFHGIGRGTRGRERVAILPPQGTMAPSAQPA